MGSLRRKTFHRPLPLYAERLTRKGGIHAKWKGTNGKLKTAPVATAADGSLKIVLLCRRLIAKYRTDRRHGHADRLADAQQAGQPQGRPVHRHIPARHHCYRRCVSDEEEQLTGEDRKEAEQREQAARVWIGGLESIQRKIGIKTVYDLSATPFFLRGSGYGEAKLFPWVVSDLSLIDAIESGIVKVPRVPVADDAMTGDQPTYRDLWLRRQSRRRSARQH